MGDFVGGVLYVMGEVVYFIGYYCEVVVYFFGLCGFDGGVEGK